MIQKLGATAITRVAEFGALMLVAIRIATRIATLRVDRKELLRAGERFGFQSVPVIAATAFFTGGIMTMQGLPYAQQMQAMSLLPWAASFTTLREVGPVLIGLMFSGRVGSNNTAELGTMAVTEQVDAMRLLALDPYELLIAPRFIAMVVMMVALLIVGDACAIVGAALTAKVIAGLDIVLFFELVREQVELQDFTRGVIKAGCFGTAIAVMSCHFGLSANGGARGVGKAVNAAVVGSAFGIIVLDWAVTSVLG